MKVLCVIDSLGSGGAQRQFVNVVNGLSEQHDISVLLYNPGSDFYGADLGTDVPIHRVERPQGMKGFRFDVVSRLVQLMRSVDVVVSFLPTANVYCALTSFLCPRTKHISCEMSVVNETESRLRRAMANFANSRSDHVICNSFTQAAYISGQRGMKHRVSTVWNGCADLAFAPPDFASRKKHGFLVVARVAYPKNGVRLLQALDIFQRRHGYCPPVSWAGRDDSDALARKMKADMQAFLETHPDVSRAFTWLGEQPDVQSLYSEAEALLSVSTYEGVPVVICEAMLAGCPVVASAISDNAVILGDGERGFLCDPLSPEDICAALERRLDASPEDLRVMVDKSRAYAEESFSIAGMARGYDRVIALVTKNA